MKVTVKGTPALNQTMQNMKVGDVAVITSRGSYLGARVLRTYQGFVSLDRPGTTWDLYATIEVTILPPGTEITLVTE